MMRDWTLSRVLDLPKSAIHPLVANRSEINRFILERPTSLNRVIMMRHYFLARFRPPQTIDTRRPSIHSS